MGRSLSIGEGESEGGEVAGITPPSPYPKIRASAEIRGIKKVVLGRDVILKGHIELCPPLQRRRLFNGNELCARGGGGAG